MDSQRDGVRAPMSCGWHMQGGKGELTSCRCTVQSAWQKPPVKRKGGRIGLWPGGWGPQGVAATVGGGLARVPNLRVSEHLVAAGWHAQGGKGELTSCRGTVLSAWQVRPVTYPRMRQETGKAGENGQNSGDGAARSSWTRPSAPGCGDTLKA